jgi:hypothetical protein
LVRAAIAVACCWSASCSSAFAATESATAPDFAVVAAAVEAHFASLADYKPGDLVARSQIEAALASVKQAGWDVPHADRIVARSLADDSFLVARLRTPAGRKFMRKVAAEPDGFARLDRLSSISGGQTLVDDLVRRKGGHELIRYLATTEGGRHLGRQLAATPHGVDINKPTDRIYTADDLLAALQSVWQTP